jgi:plastocyanin
MRGLAVTGVIGMLALALAAPAAASRLEVRLGADGPKPSVIIVAPGAKVRWVNDDVAAHTLRGDVSSPAIPPGGAFARRFLKIGEYRYRDAANSALRGTVVVAAGGGAGGGGVPPRHSHGLAKHRYRATVTLLNREAYRFYDDKYHTFRGPCNGEIGDGTRFERLTVNFAEVTYSAVGRTEVLTGHSSHARVRQREFVDAHIAAEDSPFTDCPDGTREPAPNRHVHCESRGPRSAGSFELGWIPRGEDRLLLTPRRARNGELCGLAYVGPLGLTHVDAEELPLFLVPQGFAYDTASLGPLKPREIKALRSGRPVTISREVHLSWLASCCASWVPKGFIGGVLVRIGSAWSWDAKMTVRLTPR